MAALGKGVVGLGVGLDTQVMGFPHPTLFLANHFYSLILKVRNHTLVLTPHLRRGPACRFLRPGGSLTAVPIALSSRLRTPCTRTRNPWTQLTASSSARTWTCLLTPSELRNCKGRAVVDQGRGKVRFPFVGRGRACGAGRNLRTWSMTMEGGEGRSHSERN